jgi:hypothetical protein
MSSNYRGRTIHTEGPGFHYVIHPLKVYRFVTTNSNRNSFGSKVYIGPRGGRYIIHRGRKLYI